MLIKMIDLINPDEFKRTSDETFFLANNVKSLIVDSKIENPKDSITIELIKSDSLNAKIINALAKSVASEWEDITIR